MKKNFFYIHLRKEDWWKLGQIFHSFRSVAPGPKNLRRQAIELQFLPNMNLNLHCTKNLPYLLAIFCVNTYYMYYKILLSVLNNLDLFFFLFKGSRIYWALAETQENWNSKSYIELKIQPFSADIFFENTTFKISCHSTTLGFQFLVILSLLLYFCIDSNVTDFWKQRVAHFWKHL